MACISVVGSAKGRDDLAFGTAEAGGGGSVALGVGTRGVRRTTTRAVWLTFTFAGPFHGDLRLGSIANGIVLTCVPRFVSGSWRHGEEYGSAGSTSSTRDMDGSLQCRRSEQENTEEWPPEQQHDVWSQHGLREAVELHGVSTDRDLFPIISSLVRSDP